MTLREGHADLHQRLTYDAVWGFFETGDMAGLDDLLTEARAAVLHCPHDCALCTQVERKETQ